jgi:hypothetical protein
MPALPTLPSTMASLNNLPTPSPASLPSPLASAALSRSPLHPSDVLPSSRRSYISKSFQMATPTPDTSPSTISITVNRCGCALGVVGLNVTVSMQGSITLSVAFAGYQEMRIVHSPPTHNATASILIRVNGTLIITVPNLPADMRVVLHSAIAFGVTKTETSTSLARTLVVSLGPLDLSPPSVSDEMQDLLCFVKARQHIEQWLVDGEPGARSFSVRSNVVAELIKLHERTCQLIRERVSGQMPGYATLGICRPRSFPSPASAAAPPPPLQEPDTRKRQRTSGDSDDEGY